MFKVLFSKIYFQLWLELDFQLELAR